MEMKGATKQSKDDRGNYSKAPKEESSSKYGTNRETMANKYAAIREQQSRKASSTESKDEISPVSVSLLEPDESQKPSTGKVGGSPAALASAWASMKTSFQNVKANIGAKKFLPLRQAQAQAQAQNNDLHTRNDSSESLDEIFQRLKQRPNRDQKIEFDFDDDVDSSRM